jgi:hypothetical protein
VLSSYRWKQLRYSISLTRKIHLERDLVMTMSPAILERKDWPKPLSRRGCSSLALQSQLQRGSDRRKTEQEFLLTTN